MGNVLGYAELLKKDETVHERRSDLQRIIDSALIGREIVKKLMYFSCEMPAQFQLADANKALHDVLHLLEQRMEQQHVMLQWHLAEGLPPVRMDQVQFAQVISNLVLNAAAAIYVSGAADDYEVAVGMARSALAEGAGMRALERLRKASPRKAG